MLNIIWLSFFFLAFIAALWQWLSGSNPEVFSDLIASSFDFRDREFIISQLGFLQAEHIHRRGFQPLQHLRQAYFEGIDIPCGEFH